MNWTTSSYCSAGGCVEVAIGSFVHRAEPTGGCTDDEKTVWVRNTADPTVAVGFTAEEWVAHCEGVKAGEFDLDRLK